MDLRPLAHMGRNATNTLFGTFGRLHEPVTGRAWSSPEVASRVAVRVSEYDQARLEPGERVFLHYGNTLEFFVDLLAVWHLGGCAVPLDPRLTTFAVSTLARDARPRFAVLEDSSSAQLASSLSDAGVACLDKPVGGMKIHPADVDAVIERFPATVDVCAFAVDDPLLGEDVAVAIVLGAAGEAALPRVQAWTAAHLASHQLPRKWFVVDAIPRTERGKVSRARVAALCGTLSPTRTIAAA